MMVQHNHIHAALLEPCDGFDRRRAAIHSQQERCGEFFQAVFHAFPAQAVAFVHAIRQVVMCRPSERAQNFGQQRSRGHAVHVIITENDERFVRVRGGMSLEEALDCGSHVRQQEGIGKLLEARLKEAVDQRGFAQAAVEEALGEQG